MIRKVFVNPGDVLDIRIITDPDVPRNNKEWEYQMRPTRMLITVAGSDHIKLTHGMGIRVEEVTANGTSLRYRD